MALSKLFQRIFWHNNTTPAINEDNLNAMSKAIDDIDDRVISLAETIIEDVPVIIEGLADLDTAVTTATEAATTASNAATTATTKAGEASASATTASTKAGEASGSATTASNKADAASASATTAGNKALISEGFAVGEQDGTPVTSGSPYYQNNAEYYATEAGSSAQAAAASATEAGSWSAHPPYIGSNGNWYVWDVTDAQYEDSGIDASITVSVGTTSTLPAGSSAAVTNSGTSTDPVLNFGIPQGAAGTDGVSPEVTISSITGGHTVTITDADHPTGQSFNVMDGSGVTDYDDLTDKPRINNILLSGNKSSGDLKLQANMGMYATRTFGALSSITAWLNAGNTIPNNSTLHINDYDTDYVVTTRAAGDTEAGCIFISETQKIIPLYQSGTLDIRAFGAGHTNTADNSAKIVKAIKFAQSNNIKLYVPRGRWYLKESIPLNGATIIEGATSAGDRGLTAANCSIIFFDPEQSNVSMFTESSNHTLSIHHLTIICGKVITNEQNLEEIQSYSKYEGDYTTQVAEIPHNYMTWTYSYTDVNCLNCYNSASQYPRNNSSWLDLLDVNIAGFSGYGVKCGMALTLDSVRFYNCKYGFYNVLTDTQFHNTFIQGCEYGFYWDNGGTVLFAYDTWIDQCKYGIYSNLTLSGVFQGGEIDHCLYAGVCCLGGCDLKIEARFGRLGMYYLGEDMLAKAQLITTYSESDFLDMSKGVDIAVRWGLKFNIDLSEEPKEISDNGTVTDELPTLLVFGQTLRGIIKTAHDFADRTYYSIRGDACVTVENYASLTEIDALPTASSYNLNKSYLLTGTQTGYVKGSMYKCVENNGVYSWELLNGSGDMLSTSYDPNGTVATAGGIVSYVSGEISSAVTSALTASY